MMKIILFIIWLSALVVLIGDVIDIFLRRYRYYKK